MDAVSLSTITKQLNEWLRGAIALVPNLILGVIVFFCFWFIAGFVRKIIKRSTRRSSARNLGAVFGRLAQVALIILGFLLAAVIIVPNFNPADILASLGIGGVAIGFAFKDILQNFLAGILILVTEPFKIDDQIIYNGIEGTVERIQTRATIIRTYDGRKVVLPNGELFTNAVTVNTGFDKRRLQYDIGIGYGDDIAQAKEIILRVLNSSDEILSDPSPEALVVDLAGSSINIRARWWIHPPRRADAMTSFDWVLEQVCNELVAAGIDLPFPTQQILFHDQTEETDGDRARQREGWPTVKGSDDPQPLTLSRSVRQAFKSSE